MKIYLKGAKTMFENAKVAFNYKVNGKTVAFSENNEDLAVNYSKWLPKLEPYKRIQEK